MGDGAAVERGKETLSLGEKLKILTEAVSCLTDEQCEILMKAVGRVSAAK